MMDFYNWYTTTRRSAREGALTSYNNLWETKHTWGPPLMALWVWHNVFTRELRILRAKNPRKAAPGTKNLGYISTSTVVALQYRTRTVQ